MKLTKRILCLALVLALAVALCACGKKDEGKKESTPVASSGFTSSTAANSDDDDWEGNLEGENQYNDATFGEW